MISSTKSRVFLLAFVLSLSLAKGQAPSGLINFSFDAPGTFVYDLSGSLSAEQQLSGAGGQETPISYAVDVTQDSSGKLSGSGNTLVNVGNDFIGASYTIKGKVSGGGNSINKASFTVKLNGQDTVAGRPNTKFSISISYKLEANSEEKVLFGTARGSASFSGLSSGNIRSDVTITLPTDGSWTADLNILALKKLTGSAVITLPNTRTLSTRLSGSYNSTTAVSKVKLSGFDASKGTSVNLDFISSAEGTEVEKLRGKILGQSIRQ